MSRRFSGSNDEVRYPTTAASNFTAAASMAVLLKFNAANNVWQNLITHHVSAGTFALGIERAGPGGTTDTVGIAIASGTKYGTTTIRASDGWIVVGFSRAATSTAWRVHIFKAGAWTHEAGGALNNNSNAPSQTGGSIRLGELEDTDDLDGWVAADAGWAADIGDAGFDALTTTLDLADWVAHATPPAYVHQHNQATASEDILDLMGNGHVATGTISGTTDAVGIAGTSMDTGNEPSGWTYYGAPAGRVSKQLAAMGVG